MGFKMKGPSLIGGTQKHTDAVESKRAASVKVQKADCHCGNEDCSDCAGNSPNKFFMKAAGMLIGANKRRQAGKDAADKHVGDAKAAAYGKKIG
tara:strand:- start:712 stop:993 length:282 start_codon:yes stop_codon:yes gene_type:complete